MRITLCILTYRRPRGLRAALEAVATQMFEGDERPQLRVLVVDNDEERSAADTCEEMGPRMPWPLDYAVEPRRGIPFARNRSVALARPSSDWIGFIDDDEEPSPTWLADLLRARAEFDADVVTGPVLPKFAGEAPGWAIKGRLFDRLRYPTGTFRDRAFTNNVLFRAEVFDRVQPHFDERMALTGGSDTHFSQRVHRTGFRIVWADEAIVHETIPASRMAARWVYQRAYRVGTTNGFIARDLHPLPRAMRLVLPSSSYRLLKGLVLATIGWVVGRHHGMIGIRHLCYGAGMVVGLCGGRYDEYRRTHSV